MALPVEIIHRPGPAILTWIAKHLREWDRREIMATRWSEEPADLAREAALSGDTSWAALVDGIPAVAYGAFPMWPGVWSVWAFGTDNFRHAGREVTRHIRRAIIPGMAQVGARRAQAYSMDGHDDAQRWIKALGGKRESIAYGYGKGGEDFHLFVYQWPRGD